MNQTKTHSRPYNSKRNQSRDKVHKDLSLILKRKIKLKRFPMIAQLALLRKRPDLAALLAETQKNHQEMPNRLIDYLTKEKLWNKTEANLTKLGKKVRETELFEVKERGFYHIWYTDDDPLLDTRPLLVQRDNTFFDPKEDVWKKGVDAKHSNFKYSDDSSIDICILNEPFKKAAIDLKSNLTSLVALEPEVICSPKKEAMIDLTWQLSSSRSTLALNGMVDILNFSNKGSNEQQPHKLNLILEELKEQFSEVIDTVTHRLNGTWNLKKQRMAVELEHIQPYSNAVNKFVLSNISQDQLETKIGDFDRVDVTNLPIQPQNQQDAHAWHLEWLDKYYSNNYSSTDSARKRQATWLDHNALQSFELPLYQTQSLLQELSRGKQPKAYWHVAALADLTPSNDTLHLPISLVDGDSLDLATLTHQLTGRRSVDTVIYSDRYVHTSRHCRNLSEITHYFNAKQGQLLTLATPKGEQLNLPENWQQHVFEKKSENHGRFWIFISQQNISCWECTSGLDFIKEDEGEYFIDGYPTFIPKETSELPRYLKDIISESKGMEVVE